MNRAAAPAHTGRRSRRRAFTLLEMLAATGVLVIIGLIIAKMVGATSDAARLSNSGIDAAAQARLAFDRLELDLARTVRRHDADFAVTNQPAPNLLEFLSEVTSAGIAPADNRGISLVGYRIGATADSPLPCLLRAGKALDWQTAGLAGYDLQGLPPRMGTLPVTLTDADFDVLAPGVIRIVFGFQLYPDGEALTLADGTQIASGAGQIVYSPPVRLDQQGQPTVFVDRTRIASIVTGVVAMNPETRKLLQPNHVTAMAARFPVPDPGVLPTAAWSQIAENADGMPLEIPLPARRSLRVFQRAFSVTPYGTFRPAPTP